MPETIEITSELEELLDVLENARNTSNIAVWWGDTTYRGLEEWKNISGTFFVEGDPKQLVLLSRSFEEYFGVRREVVQSRAMQHKSTEEWPTTLEFEGVANDACIEFCNTCGLVSDLRKCLNEAKSAFSNRQSLMAEYDCFDEDEYEEDGHVVIRIKVNSDEETALEEYNYFTDWMLDNVSDDNLGLFFVTVNQT